MITVTLPEDLLTDFDKANPQSVCEEIASALQMRYDVIAKWSHDRFIDIGVPAGALLTSHDRLQGFVEGYLCNEM